MNKNELLQDLSIIMNKDNYKDIRKRLKVSYKKDVEKFIYYFSISLIIKHTYFNVKYIL